VTALASTKQFGPEVSNSGDIGMTNGRYVQVITGAQAYQGRDVMVWRRDSAGDRKVLTETHIPDPPRPARRRRAPTNRPCLAPDLPGL
jgi:hypothetical protein